MRRERQVRALALATCLLGLGVVGVSAFLRLSGAGLGCADWPGCYGQVLAGVPSFEVNGALLSRAAVYVLKSLSEAELGELFERARSKALPGLEFDAAAKERLVGLADGDARRLLNALEILHTAATTSERRVVDADFLQGALAKNLRRFDKGGEAFYDQISALHKSVRGSDPDASLYWLLRMLDGGADPLYLGRRIVRMATEDIGLADPRALQIALNAVETFERLGSPEGELALAQAAVYLAMAPKSNAVYSAWNAVRELVRKDGTRPVPEHLRNAPTRLMKDLGYGRDYRYAHDEPDGFAAGERYLPEGLPRTRFYEPVPRGLELRIGERLAELRRANARALERGGTDRDSGAE